MRRIVLCVSLTICATCLLACGGAGGPSAKPQEDSKEQKELQAKRNELIDDLMKKGAFTKYNREAGSKHAQVWVTPQFMLLDFDKKKDMMSILAAYLFNVPKDGSLEAGQTLSLLHKTSGKEVGTYTSGGLQME